MHGRSTMAYPSTFPTNHPARLLPIITSLTAMMASHATQDLITRLSWLVRPTKLSKQAFLLWSTTEQIRRKCCCVQARLILALKIRSLGVTVFCGDPRLLVVWSFLAMPAKISRLPGPTISVACPKSVVRIPGPITYSNTMSAMSAALRSADVWFGQEHFCRSWCHRSYRATWLT